MMQFGQCKEKAMLSRLDYLPVLAKNTMGEGTPKAFETMKGHQVWFLSLDPDGHGVEGDVFL